MTHRDLTARSVDTELAGRTVRVPAADDVLVFLAHHGAVHRWSRLGWLADVAAILARVEALDLDLDRATETAAAARSRVTFASALILAAEVLGAPLPSGTMTACLDVPGALALAGEFAVAIARRLDEGLGSREQHEHVDRLDLVIHERRTDRVATVLRRLRPGPTEWALLDLPWPLAPLYVPVRAARLSVKWARAAARHASAARSMR
jgi:hypothetical protein